MSYKPKIYLAGPEVFLPNVIEHAETQRALCRRYDFDPLHPMDNNIDPAGVSFETALRIYEGDVSQVRDCDIIVANCNAFRGACVDDGTAVELGMAFALGKVAYGYMSTMGSLAERTRQMYPCRRVAGIWIDREGYVVIDDRGTSINLMLQCGLIRSGGALIAGDFEACLKRVRHDFDKKA